MGRKKRKEIYLGGVEVTRNSRVKEIKRLLRRGGGEKKIREDIDREPRTREAKKYRRNKLLQREGGKLGKGSEGRTH